MAYLIEPKLLSVDIHNIDNIVNGIINKNFDIKYNFVSNFKQNRNIITQQIINKLNKYVKAKEVYNNNFYTEQPGIFLQITYNDIEINIVVLRNIILKVKENHKYLYEPNDNSIIITNLITAILQYDFNIKYEFKKFEKNLYSIKEELINRININEFHSILASEFIPITPRLKPAIYLKIVDKSKFNTQFLIAITENRII